VNDEGATSAERSDLLDIEGGKGGGEEADRGGPIQPHQPQPAQPYLLDGDGLERISSKGLCQSAERRCRSSTGCL
jgi:hypothetical protein